MVGVHTKVNTVDAALFTKSHVNAVVISTLVILRIHTHTHTKTEQNFQDLAQRSCTIIIRNLSLITSLKNLHKN